MPRGIYPRLPIPENYYVQLHAELTKEAGPDECWTWQGRIGNRRYGRMAYRSKDFGAHVMALRLRGVDVPKGSVVMHSCDNPPCVNPAHLSVGSQADNRRDAAAKGRTASGERNGNAKLTDQQFAEIVRRTVAGDRQADIAREFGITPQAVSQYLKRHSELTSGG